MAATPPPELLAAINSSASKYGLSPGTLIGIWRIESGGHYPNPYVNSSGYGGLFGTGQGSYQWSTQRQADYAAKILAGLIRSEGSLSAALLKYSGGAYSSVDESGGDTPATGDTGGGAVPARPGGDTATSQDASIVHGPLGGAVDIFGKVFGGLWKGATEIGSSLVQIARGIAALVHFVTDLDNWLRLVEFLTGFGLILFGIAVYIRVFGGQSSPPAATPAPVREAVT